MDLNYHPKLTERIIQQTPRTIIGLIFISAIYIWVYFEFIPTVIMLSWIIAQIIFIALRSINAKNLARAIKINDAFLTKKQTQILLGLIIYSAIVWSSATLIGLAYAPKPYEFIGLTMILGIISAGALTLSPFFHIFLAYFIILMTTQLGIMLSIGDQPHNAISLMIIGFILSIYTYSKSIYLDTLHSISINQALEKNISELHELSITDSLTNLYNRRHFFLAGNKLFSLSKREKTDLALLMIDIDHFKKINDTHGHKAGDEILISFAKEIEGMARESDVFARVGGEEFALLLNNTSLNGAKKVAHKICDAINDKTFYFNKIEINITVSIGISLLNEINNSNLDTLYIEADNMLYQAKEMGRNRVCS